MRRRPDAAAPTVLPVALLGSVSVLGTAWFAWSLPAAARRRRRAGAALAEDVAPWRWAYEHLAPPASPRALAAVLVGVTVAMLAAWAAAIVLTWRRSTPARVRTVVVCVGIACAIGVLALPTHSTDIYDYALFGRVGSVNGGEPYHDLPDAYPDDPLYQYSSHQYTGHPDNKLPVWTMVATGLADAAGDHPLVVLLAFRALLAGATLLATVLVARLATRLRARGAAAAVATFGLCPVTLVYGGAKTDALMVLLMLVGLALVADRRATAGTVVTTLAVMVKAIAAPVLGLVALGPSAEPRPGRHPAWGVAGRSLLAVAVAVGVYLPFRDPAGLVRAHLSEPDHTSAASLAVPVALAALAVLAVGTVAWAWRQRPSTALERVEVVVAASAPLLVAFAATMTRPGLPWYLLTPLAVVALARSAPLLIVLGALASSSFLMGWWESVDTRAHPLPEVQGERSDLYLLVAALAAALAVAWVVGRRLRGRPAAPVVPLRRAESERAGVRRGAADAGCADVARSLRSADAGGRSRRMTWDIDDG